MDVEGFSDNENLVENDNSYEEEEEDDAGDIE